VTENFKEKMKLFFLIFLLFWTFEDVFVMQIEIFWLNSIERSQGEKIFCLNCFKEFFYVSGEEAT